MFQNGEKPPLDRPDGYFDLIWCVSVFTHLTDTWSAWLLELRRVLAPGGLLVITYMGEGMSELITGESWDERNIGMNVRRIGQSWELGGPMVLHSPWWIREHWGRAFEIVEVRPYGFAMDPPSGQGTVVLRKNDVEVDIPAIERIQPGDEREVDALLHNARTLTDEIVELRRNTDHLGAGLEDVSRRLSSLEDAHSVVTGSRSWRLTAPLRGLGQHIRGLRSARSADADVPR